MREAIKGYTEAVIEEAAARGQGPGVSGGVLARLTPPASPHPTLPELAADLRGVVDVLAGSEDLSLVLTDSDVPDHSRRGLVDDLFGHRVDADAMRLLDFVVETDRAPATVDDIRWLATRVAAARDGLHPVGATVLGHRAALERVDGYASAVLEQVRTENHLDSVEDELFRFQRTVLGSSDLSAALTSGSVEVAARRGLVVDLLAGKASDATTRMAAYAVSVGRARDYLELLEALVARVAAETRRRVAEVRVATELTEEQRTRLGNALGRIVGQRVEVRTVVDRSVLGGFVATIGDTVIDGSVRHRLDLLKDRLLLPETPATS